MIYHVNAHSSICLRGSKTIYIDPFQITGEKHDADLIFITHSHYDHLSEQDIKKVMNEKTRFVLPETCLSKFEELHLKSEYLLVQPNNHYTISEISFATIPAYNVGRSFHLKENEWVGYLISFDHVTCYIAGDTDLVEENQNIQCDVAFVPIGGTYTMNADGAAKLINQIVPKVVVPIHYGSIVGSYSDALSFQEQLLPQITCDIVLKENENGDRDT